MDNGMQAMHTVDVCCGSVDGANQQKRMDKVDVSHWKRDSE